MPDTLQDAPTNAQGAPPRTLCANELRWLAEKADGLRGQPLFLVEDQKKGLDVVSEEDLNGRTPLVFIDTKSRGIGIPENPKARAKARIECNGQIYDDQLLDEADTLFLSQSSVEKFLLPYYMRFKSGAEVQGIENMLFNKAGVIAALHIPPSLPKAWPKVAALSPKPGSSKLICEIR